MYNNYNLKGSRSSIDDFFLRACPVGVSDAPDGRRSNRETAVCWSGWTGVLEPDGVLVLGAGLAGDRSPLGVLGLDPVPLSAVFLAEDKVTELRPDVVGVLLGILDGVSSVLSSDRLDPCLDGGLLPGLLPVRDAGRELLLEPPGVKLDL